MLITGWIDAGLSSLQAKPVLSQTLPWLSLWFSSEALVPEALSMQAGCLLLVSTLSEHTTRSCFRTTLPGPQKQHHSSSITNDAWSGRHADILALLDQI